MEGLPHSQACVGNHVISLNTLGGNLGHELQILLSHCYSSHVLVSSPNLVGGEVKIRQY